jgi:hypothetical protein
MARAQSPDHAVSGTAVKLTSSAARALSLARMAGASRVRSKCVSTKDSFLHDIWEAANTWPFFPCRKEPPSFARIPVLFLEQELSDKRLKNSSEIARKTMNAANPNAGAPSRSESKVNKFRRVLLTVAFGTDRARLDARTDQCLARDGRERIRAADERAF